MPDSNRKSPASISWERTSDPEYELLTVAEARRHLRLESYGGDEDAAEDLHLQSLIAVAGEVIETHTSRPVRAQGRRLYIGEGDAAQGDYGGVMGSWAVYWDGGVIRLNATPIRSIDAVRWIDEDGVEQTMPAGDYSVVGVGNGINRPVEIRPVGDTSWPWRYRYRDQSDDTDIRIEVRCGWEQAQLPEPIKHAARILVNDAYSHRSELVVGASVASVPRSVNALLGPYVRVVLR